jgi:hypothetical protein
VCLDRTLGHLELMGNLRVVTALEQQFRDLLLTRTQTNKPFLHASFPPFQDHRPPTVPLAQECLPLSPRYWPAKNRLPG